jgi:hypothetical protein
VVTQTLAQQELQTQAVGAAVAGHGMEVLFKYLQAVQAALVL